MQTATIHHDLQENLSIRKDHTYQAYQILHCGFVAAPLIAGVDKFFHFLTNWDRYLAPVVSRSTGIDTHTFMLGVGVVEIAAALLVAIKPRLGAYIVAAWLGGIIINLLLLPGFYDIALRDFGLLLGALALGRLSERFDGIQSKDKTVGNS
jgi:hypothetical protein